MLYRKSGRTVKRGPNAEKYSSLGLLDQSLQTSCNPRGSIYTPIMELGSSQNHSRDGLLGPNSIIVVHMDPLVTSKYGVRSMLRASSLRPCKGEALGAGFQA